MQMRQEVEVLEHDTKCKRERVCTKGMDTEESLLDIIQRRRVIGNRV